jgi:hypothetical membrane protein
MTLTEGITGVRIAGAEDRRRAGLFFFVLAAQFMLVIMLAASIAPGYDFNGAAISDLGVIASTALLFNASLVVVGVLNVLGGFLYYRSHRRGWVLVLFVVASIGAVGTAAFPLDRGEVHSLFALVSFLFFNVEAIAVGALVGGAMKLISVLAGALGLVFVVLLVIGDGGNAAAFGAIGYGGTERMIVYPAMLWMLALGGHLMAARDGAEPGRD